MNPPLPGSNARRGILALAVGTAAVVAGALGLGLRLDDAFQRRLPAAQRPPAPVAVVGIDAAEPWPWSNERLAALLDRLRAAGALGVGLDLPLVAAVPTDAVGDARLARALFDGKVVLGVPLAAGPDGTLQPQLPPTGFVEAVGLGHVLLPRDRDGRIRRHLPHASDSDGTPWPSLPLALLQHVNASEPAHGPGASWQLVDAGTAPAAWSAAELMAGRIENSRLHGHWVLVGLADPARQPQLPGPHGSAPLYPVQHQARALSALLAGATPRPLPAPVQALLALAITGVAAYAGLSRNAAGWRMPVALCGGIVAALSLSAILLAYRHWFAPGATAGVLALCLLTWTATVLVRQGVRRRRMPGIATRRDLQAAVQAAGAANAPHAMLLLEIRPPANDGRKARETRARDLADLLRNRARRPEDIAAWLGGGHFALLLHGASDAAAGDILDQIYSQASDRGLVLQGQMHACSANDCTCAKKGPGGIAA